MMLSARIQGHINKEKVIIRTKKSSLTTTVLSVKKQDTNDLIVILKKLLIYVHVEVQNVKVVCVIIEKKKEAMCQYIGVVFVVSLVITKTHVLHERNGQDVNATV